MKPIALALLILLTACVPASPLVQTVSDNRVYLPVIQYDPPYLFGVENEDAPGDTAEQYYRGDFAKISIHWALVEPLPGYYDWSYADDKVFGSPVMLSLKGAPAWANGSQPVCSPPLPEYLPLMITFLDKAIERYQPFAVEFWNEPEGTAFAPLYLGCFGDDYAAGVQYAELFNQVYAALKPLHPHTIFIAGALLDARLPFAEGMLNTIAHADAVSFHVYEWCNADRLLDTQIERLRSLTDLPLVLSETSLIYLNDSLVCDQAQVEYLRQVRADERLLLASWYSLVRDCHRDWRHSTMVLVCDDVIVKPVWLEYER